MGGGQGGDVVQIKKMWSMTGTEENPTFTEIEKVIEEECTYYNITDRGGVVAYIATDDEYTPNWQDYKNIVLLCNTSYSEVMYNKNIGAHRQRYSSVGSVGIYIEVFHEIDDAPFIQININYDK